jgi:methyl-accepting chemotaxis protein
MILTIGRKLVLGYLVALFIVTAIGVITYQGIANLLEHTRLVARTQKVLAETASLWITLADAESGSRAYLLTGDVKELSAVEALNTVAGSRKVLRGLTANNPVQQRALDILEPLLDRKIAVSHEIVTLRGNANARVAVGAVRTDCELMAEIEKTIRAMEADEKELLRRRDQLAQATASRTVEIISYGGLLGFVLVAFANVAIHRSITHPLSEFHRFVTAVGEGDLTQVSALDGGDELGKLAQSLNRMVAGLKDVALQTRGVTDNLNSAVVDILSSARQQAASTGDRVAACQETNVTMQQVSQSCFQMSEKAKQVAATAEAISVASHSGLETVQNTNRSMESIREQAEAVADNVIALSEKTQMVGDIVATVNDIAEQSHLLALNAAIEAAAAGEHGRSFAVVAGEIKNLADQSKEATVQVKTILGDIQKGINSSVMLTEEVVKRVELGKRLADQAASTTREMTSSIQESVQAFQQIMAGSNQQQIGFEHVMQAVKDIGQGSEQAVSSTRQMERAAAGLAALGEQLQKATDRYRL